MNAPQLYVCAAAHPDGRVLLHLRLAADSAAARDWAAARFAGWQVRCWPLHQCAGGQGTGAPETCAPSAPATPSAGASADARRAYWHAQMRRLREQLRAANPPSHHDRSMT